MLKRYFWLVNVLLVTLAAAFGADITKSYITAKLAVRARPKQLPHSNTPNLQVKAPFSDYQVITTRNIFNANPPKEGAKPEVTPPPQAPLPTVPTQLQLKLVGIVAGLDNQRYAIIEDLQSRGAQSVYQVGDIVQSALINEIRPDCVVLDKGGQPEVLCFQYDTDSNGQAPGRRAAVSTPPPAAEDESGILKVDDATWRVSRDLIMEQFSSLGNLSRQARLSPYFVQGKPQGFRISRLQRDTLLQKIGLLNGDVLQKVNGLNITSPDEALQAFQQLRNEATVRLEILRNNNSSTLTYEIR